MENNNYYQQVQYQPVQVIPPVDQAYMALANEFLTKAIVAGAISSLPVGCFIALSMASKNRKKILEYIEQGGYHTVRIKTCSAISRAAKYSAVACSIVWGVYGTIWLVYALAMLIFFLAAVVSGNY